MEQLSRCTDKVQEMLNGEEYDWKLASHLSWLTRHMAANLDAMRKQEAAERLRWKTMSRQEELELIKVWLEEASVEDRQEIGQYIEGMGQGGGLLA